MRNARGTCYVLLMARVMRRQGTYLVGRAGGYLLATLSSLLAAGILALVIHPVAGVLPLPWALASSYRYARYTKGWSGEREVVQALSGLDDSYYIVHDARIPKANIDHIVLGPNGVFVVETKNFSGRVICDHDTWRIARPGAHGQGHEIRSPSIQAKRNAIRVRQRISEFEQTLLRGFPRIEWVHAVVVLANPQAEIVLDSPAVPVVGARELVDHITGTRSPVTLPPTLLTKIGLALIGMETKA